MLPMHPSPGIARYEQAVRSFESVQSTGRPPSTHATTPTVNVTQPPPQQQHQYYQQRHYQQQQQQQQQFQPRRFLVVVVVVVRSKDSVGKDSEGGSERGDGTCVARPGTTIPLRPPL